MHVGEPINVVRVVLARIEQSRFPLPRNLYDDLCEWIRWLPNVAQCHRDFARLTDIRLVSVGLPVSPENVDYDAPFGDATLCYFILDEFDAENSPRSNQEAVIRAWLDAHRPCPALRVDLRACGFGNLL